MRKLSLLFTILLLSCVSRLWAQTPQHVHQGSTPANNNAFPFTSGFNKIQWLYKGGVQFPGAPSGNITKLYFKSHSNATSTISDLKIRIAPTTLNALSPSAFETQGFVTVLDVASQSVTAVQGQWMEFTLQNPFPYTAGQNFIVEVTKASGTAQVQVYQTIPGYVGRIHANSETSTVPTSSQDRVGEMGIDISPATTTTITGSDTLCVGSSQMFFGAPAGGTWSSSNTGVASINSSGLINPLTQGSTTITYTVGTSTATKNIFVKTPFQLQASLAASPGTNLCPNTSVTITPTVSPAGSLTYLWLYNGSAGPIQNTNPTLTSMPPVGNTVYSVIVNSSLACAIADTADITISVSSGQTASVSIISNLTTQACEGSPITFTATPTNGGTTPVYQWKKNGNNVGTNSATYTDATLITGDLIRCDMTSNATGVCIGSAPVSSNVYNVQFLPLVTAVAQININPLEVCAGEPVTATITPTHGGSSPIFAWFVNNNPVTGSGSTYTFTPANNDAIHCVMTSNENCVANASVQSVSVNVLVHAIPNPLVTLSNGILSSSIANGNQWYKDGAIIPGATNQTYTPTENGAYHVVASNNDCEASSNVITYQGVSVRDLQLSTDDLKLFPNPARSWVKIENNSGLRINRITLINMLGQEVYSTKKSNLQTIDISALPSGIYNVKITFNEGEVNRKLNIEK